MSQSFIGSQSRWQYLDDSSADDSSADDSI